MTVLYERDLSRGNDDLITPTKTGHMNTTANLEHRMKVIMKNAGLSDVQGGLHIFRKTFASQMYEQGTRVVDNSGAFLLAGNCCKILFWGNESRIF